MHTCVRAYPDSETSSAHRDKASLMCAPSSTAGGRVDECTPNSAPNKPVPARRVPSHVLSVIDLEAPFEQPKWDDKIPTATLCDQFGTTGGQVLVGPRAPTVWHSHGRHGTGRSPACSSPGREKATTSKLTLSLSSKTTWKDSSPLSGCPGSMAYAISKRRTSSVL